MATRGSSSSSADRLEQRMRALGIREEDLEESFARSGGPGGQHVNKTSTAVLLHHRPTGLRVRSEETRSQATNRRRARERLLDAIERRRSEEAQAARDRAERQRRRRRRPSASARRKTLAEKARHAAKKALRRPVASED